MQAIAAPACQWKQRYCLDVCLDRTGNHQRTGTILEGRAWIAAFVFDPEFLQARLLRRDSG
jgi:hypothetical protein